MWTCVFVLPFCRLQWANPALIFRAGDEQPQKPFDCFPRWNPRKPEADAFPPRLWGPVHARQGLQPWASSWHPGVAKDPREQSARWDLGILHAGSMCSLGALGVALQRERVLPLPGGLSICFTLRGKRFGDTGTSVAPRFAMLSVHGLLFCIFAATLE